jgi:hypothetical protein
MGPKSRGKLVTGILLAAAVLVAAGAAGAARDRKSDNPHGRKDQKSCIICHVNPPAEGQSPRRDGNLRFGGDVVALCSSCHASYSHMHPVKIAVAPDLRSPEDLPLDKDGKITCITCHDAMDEMGVHRKRRIVGRALCLNCHADSDILALVSWYPTRLRKGEQGRLEIKVVDFRLPGKKTYLGESVLLYYYAKNVETGEITFGTNILYDDGSHGDRAARDSIYTLMEVADKSGKKKKVVYTGWAIDTGGRKSNTVTLAVEYE